MTQGAVVEAWIELDSEQLKKRTATKKDNASEWPRRPKRLPIYHFSINTQIHELLISLIRRRQSKTTNSAILLRHNPSRAKASQNASDNPATQARSVRAKNNRDACSSGVARNDRYTANDATTIKQPPQPQPTTASCCEKLNGVRRPQSTKLPQQPQPTTANGCGNYC